MGECAFCSCSAKLTAEHITSKWMGRMFPAPKRFKVTDTHGNENEWTAPGLDIKAVVVCEDCNTGWMSDIESHHAKPVMAPLMRGDAPVPFGSSEARSLAIFAFKSAVIIDYAHSTEREPFFSRRLRHAFRKGLFIPQNVAMWIAPFIPENRRWRFDYRISLYKGELVPRYDLQLLVCTFNFGPLVFQVVTNKQLYSENFAPLPGFEKSSVPFWPALPPEYVWPGYGGYLRDRDDLIAFHRRWRSTAN